MRTPSIRRLALLPLVLLAAAPVSTAPPLQMAVSLTTRAAGASPGLSLWFDAAAGDPEIYRAIVRFPRDFRVRNLLALGAIGSPVAECQFDVDFDGVPDMVTPLRSLAGDTAYADVVADSVFLPDVEPSLVVAPDSLELRLPLGGDANPATRVVPAGARIVLVLLPGLIVNPTLGGEYSVEILTTTVDPESDGPDDGLGSPPETRTHAFPVRIDGPVLTSFAQLIVDHFHLKPNGASRDRFTATGHYTLAATSDGIDWGRDSVTVTFASFSQTIPLRAFDVDGPVRQYDGGPGPGIERFKLRDDGRFEVDARDLHLIVPGPTQTFLLRIGNDVGTATVVASWKPGKGR